MKSFAQVYFLVVMYSVTEYCSCYFVGMGPERSEVLNPSEDRYFVLGLMVCEFGRIYKPHDTKSSPS